MTRSDTLKHEPTTTPSAQASVVWIAANTTWYVYNFRSRLISALIESGHDVTVLAPRDRYVSQVQALGAEHVHLELSNAGTNPYAEFRTILKIVKLLRVNRPSLLLTYTPKINIYCSLAARLLRIPVIANVSGLGQAFVNRGWVQAISRILYRIAFTHPYVIFFQNESDLVEFSSNGLIDRRKAVRIPGSGVDTLRFKPAPRTERGGEFRFLFTSRLLWDKGVGEYVEAAKQLRAEFVHARFQVLGFADVSNPSAVSRDDVERWHSERVIEYLGWTDDVVRTLATIDCVVLPSYYREGVPRSLLEAASMGIPVITTDMPGCRDVVDHGVNGFLCKARDFVDLAEKMKSMLLLSENERVKMGVEGRRKMLREFSEDHVISKYLQAIAEVKAIEI